MTLLLSRFTEIYLDYNLVNYSSAKVNIFVKFLKVKRLLYFCFNTVFKCSFMIYDKLSTFYVDTYAIFRRPATNGVACEHFVYHSRHN